MLKAEVGLVEERIVVKYWKKYYDLYTCIGVVKLVYFEAENSV